MVFIAALVETIHCIKTTMVLAVLRLTIIVTKIEIH